MSLNTIIKTLYRAFQLWLLKPHDSTIITWPNSSIILLINLIRSKLL